jgi:hypothetical protein
MLAEARRQHARLVPYEVVFAEADSIRIACQSAARARHVATELGDSDDAWTLLAEAAAIEMEAMNAEAPDGRPW